MITKSDIAKLFASLYPTGRAWRMYTEGKPLASGPEVYTDGTGGIYTDGSGSPYVSQQAKQADANDAYLDIQNEFYAELHNQIDSIIEQKYPDSLLFSMDDCLNWERIYGIIPEPDATDEQRKNMVHARMFTPNAEGYAGNYTFLQQTITDAGYNVKVHENRFAGLGTETQFGTAEFSPWGFGGYANNGMPYSSQTPAEGWYQICANHIDPDIDIEIHGGDFNLNGANFLDIIKSLPNILFISGEVCFENADIQAGRIRQLRELILKYKEAHIVAILYINPI